MEQQRSQEEPSKYESPGWIDETKGHQIHQDNPCEEMGNGGSDFWLFNPVNIAKALKCPEGVDGNEHETGNSKLSGIDEKSEQRGESQEEAGPVGNHAAGALPSGDVAQADDITSQGHRAPECDSRDSLFANGCHCDKENQPAQRQEQLRISDGLVEGVIDQDGCGEEDRQ